MNFFARTIALVSLIAFSLAGCDLFEVEDRPDPNGPSVDDILLSPTPERIATVATGVQGAARLNIQQYLTGTGMIGREYWRYSASDPRLTADLLGAAPLDNNTFYITNPWGSRYANIRNANIMLQALELNEALSEEDKASARGYANTWKAHEYLMNLNLTFENGIRFIEPGEDQAGPVEGYNASLSEIAALLDAAADDLAAGGDAFFFSLSSGFSGFDTPAGFLQVNRALAARVALYAGRNADALSLLEESFIDEGGDLHTGAWHVFSSGSGDILNPFFIPPDSDGEVILAHPTYLQDMEAGDTRENKVFDRGEPTTVENLTSQYGFFVYKNSLSPIPIIRNAELLLIRAEASALENNLSDAVDDINVIRNAAGLPDYSGPMTQAAVIDEVLNQRRYELYGEGHRWIDMRRHDRLDELPIDRSGDQVWVQFPIPLNEGV